MDAEVMQIMGLDPYELPLPLELGDAVARWLVNRHPTNTDKLVARDAALRGQTLDPRTVENIRNGHLSGKTLSALLRTYRWPFARQVVAAVLTETIEQSIERELKDIAHERRELDERERDLSEDHARIRARHALGSGGLRLVHPPNDGADSEDRRAS